ncbi:MAG: hypothetical protein RBT04_07095 [Sphaerochaetaceae bacterium]|jgi:hypothetical protein|nr:hypothetical protein [Sphaerochaetaceae bacterium]
MSVGAILPPVAIENTAKVSHLSNLKVAAVEDVKFGINNLTLSISNDKNVSVATHKKDLLTNNKTTGIATNIYCDVREGIATGIITDIKTNIALGLSVSSLSDARVEAVRKTRFKIDSLRTLKHYGDFVTAVFVYANKIVTSLCSAHGDDTTIRVLIVPTYMPR